MIFWTLTFCDQPSKPNHPCILDQSRLLRPASPCSMILRCRVLYSLSVSSVMNYLILIAQHLPLAWIIWYSCTGSFSKFFHSHLFPIFHHFTVLSLFSPRSLFSMLKNASELHQHTITSCIPQLRESVRAECSAVGSTPQLSWFCGQDTLWRNPIWRMEVAHFQVYLDAAFLLSLLTASQATVTI